MSPAKRDESEPEIEDTNQQRTNRVVRTGTMTLMSSKCIGSERGNTHDGLGEKSECSVDVAYVYLVNLLC